MSEETTPSYPPLNSCVLIDSRMSSRLELKSYIQSTNLFETLIEPDTLNHGIKTITEQQIHTCIFGPSVKSENIQGFLNDLKVADYKADCAFLSTYREGTKEEIEGIHMQVMFPCSRQTFNSGIIQALQNANGGTLPPTRRNNPLTGEPLYLKNTIEKLELDDSNNSFVYSTSNPRNIRLQQNSIETESNSFISQASELTKFLLEIEPQNLRFKADGSPSKMTTETIQALVFKLFANKKNENGVMDFKFNLEHLLYDWIQVATQHGRKIANARLKEGILNYFSKAKSR